MSKQASGPVIKLSVFGAVGDAFRGGFENLGAAVVAGLFPLILLVAIQTVSFLIAPSVDTGSFFGELAFSLIGLIPYAVFAVT